MAEVVNEDTWDEIQKNAKGDYFILDRQHGQVEVEMLSEHYVVDPGDEDLVGRIHEKEFTKNEIEALVDGEKKVMELGWPTHPLIKTFIARCKKNKIKPSELPGTLWNMEKIGAWEYALEYLGRKEDSSGSSSPKQKSEPESKSYKEVKEAIESMKDEPELSNGKSRSEFLTMVAFKTGLPKKDLGGLFDKAIENGVIKEVDGTIVIE